jgi:hypothetical protein
VSKELPNISLYLRFYGEGFDPSRITKRLGIAPTSAYRAGESIAPEATARSSLKTIHRRDGWFLKVGPYGQIDIEGIIQELKDQVGLAAAHVKDISDELDIEAVVLCGVLQPTSAPAPSLRFPPEFLQWVAEMGAILEVDVILSAADES